MTELDLVQAVNHFGQGTIVDKITEYVSYVPFLIWLWLIIIILIVWRDKVKGERVLLAVVMAVAAHIIISEGLLKHGLTAIFPELFRLRPWEIIGGNIQPIGARLQDTSFPSSHMASTVAILTVLVIYYRKFWVPAVLFTLLMAFARIHNGMHFPSDVLGGTILGIGDGLIAYGIVEKIYSKKNSASTISQ